MADFKGLENFRLILLFVVPGLVALFVRSKFITGRTPSARENLLSFVVLSLVYYSLIVLIIEQALRVTEPWLARASIWILLILVGPAVFGLILGVGAQKEWASRILNSLDRRLGGKLQLYLVHVIPAAWDWRFSTLPREGVFVLVTLTSGEKVGGLFGKKSFASSDTGERDVYIEMEWDVSDDGIWKARPETVGIFIPLREVRYIEFWEPQPAEKTNG